MLLTPLQRGLLAICLLFGFILSGQAVYNWIEHAKTSRPKDTLNIGVIDDTPPYCFYSDENKLVGINIDFMNEVAKRIGMKAHIESVSFNRLTAGLITNQYDVVSIGSITPQRAKVMRYVHPHLTTDDVLVVHSGLKAIQSLDDFRGKPWKIGVYNGTSYINLLKEKGLEANMAVYPNQRDVFLAFYKGRVDAIIMNDKVATYIQSHLDPTMVLVPKRVRTDRKYAFAVRKENLVLWRKLDDAITALVNDGTFDRIQTYWLTSKTNTGHS